MSFFFTGLYLSTNPTKVSSFFRCRRLSDLELCVNLSTNFSFSVLASLFIDQSASFYQLLPSQRPPSYHLLFPSLLILFLFFSSLFVHLPILLNFVFLFVAIMSPSVPFLPEQLTLNSTKFTQTDRMTNRNICLSSSPLPLLYFVFIISSNFPPLLLTYSLSFLHYDLLCPLLP